MLGITQTSDPLVLYVLSIPSTLQELNKKQRERESLVRHLHICIHLYLHACKGSYLPTGKGKGNGREREMPEERKKTHVRMMYAS